MKSRVTLVERMEFDGGLYDVVFEWGITNVILAYAVKVGDESHFPQTPWREHIHVVGHMEGARQATGAIREAMVARLQALEPLVAQMRR